VFLKRFHREGAITSSLNHPNILRVYEVSDPHDSLHYLVTDLVVGINLDQFLQVNRLHCPELALILMLPVLKGLQALHEKDVVHRDIKPENIMVDWVRKRLTITDLGIAQPLDASRLSSFGTLVGSVAFMAPERLKKKKWDHRVDIWAFGTILYWMCTYRFPFDARSEEEMIRQIVSGSLPAPSEVNPMISPHLERVILRCLERDVQKRYPDAREIRRELEVELRSNGVDDAEEELYTYLINPRTNGKLLYQEIATGVLMNGKALLAKGPTEEALRYWERVKAYCPNDPRVQSVEPTLSAGVEPGVPKKERTGEFRPDDFDFIAQKRPKVTPPLPGWAYLAAATFLLVLLFVIWRFLL
ncbi:MAG: protein kinase, partial [Myxococcales bacterium]|nr:protein kinase [Myxococcales bacterium]